MMCSSPGSASAGARGEELERAGRTGADEDRKREACVQTGRQGHFAAMEPGCLATSVTHADSPVAMTWLGSHGTSPGCSLASRKAA